MHSNVANLNYFVAIDNLKIYTLIMTMKIWNFAWIL